MNEYKKPYLILFNAITDVIEEMEQMNFGNAKQILIEAQQKSEEKFIEFKEK